MAQQLADRRDLDFVIWEQMNLEETLTKDAYPDFNRKTCDLILNEARSLAIKELLPTMKEGDEAGVRFEDGAVRVPGCFHRPFELIKEGEWQNLSVPPEMGGQGAPHIIGAAAAEQFMAAQLGRDQLCLHGQRHRPDDRKIRHAGTKDDVCGKTHFGPVGRHHAAHRVRCRLGRGRPDHHGGQKPPTEPIASPAAKSSSPTASTT